jgi:hypothetical protein
MSRITSSVLLLLSSLPIPAASLCAAASAQSTAQATPANTSSTPNAAPGSSPSSAQTPVPAPAGTIPVSDSAVKKPKKIWTNENMTDATGTISVVGDGREGKGKNSPQTPADPQYIAKTKKDLQKLQDEITDADKQLATLKSFSEGEPVGTGTQEFHKSYNSQPIDQQRVNLEAKKKELQAKIDAFLDEARKKGVEPGQLRQ